MDTVIPSRLRPALRTIALVGVMLCLPLLYVGAVTLESTGLTVGALGFTGAVCALAIAVY